MKRLFTILLFAAMLLPLATRGQVLPDYTFRTGVDASKWITLDSTVATRLIGSGLDDAASSVTNIGFNFLLGENHYSQFSVNSNGFLRLGPDVAPYSYSYANFYYGYMPKIAGIGRDLGTGSNGYVRYQLVGQAPYRILVAEYKTCHNYSQVNNADVLVQIQLHEDSNKVVIVYGPTPNSNPTNYQIGLGVSTSDFMLITASSHAPSYHTSGTYGTTSNVWPGANRYYEFIAPSTSCPKPLNLAVNQLTNETAEISWSETGEATEWIVEYGPAGFAHGALGSNTIMVYDTTALITGLNPITAYDVYVRSYCGEGDSSKWVTTSFTTLCSPVGFDSLPYTENFEAYPATSYPENSVINACWSRFSNNISSYNIYPQVKSINGTKAILMYGSASYYSLLVTPQFESLENLQLSFDMYRSTSTGDGALLVGIMSDPSDRSTFDTIAVVNCSRQNTWERFEIPLTYYQGTGSYIAFYQPTGTPGENNLDNIVISEIGTCLTPIDVVANNITTSSADISWTDASSYSWIIEYGYSGFVRGTGTIAYSSTPSFTIQNLTASTGYDVYVRSDCGSDTSEYSIRCSFRTPCESTLPIPFFENFDSYGFGSNSNIRPECWSTGSYSSYYPYVSASYQYSGSAALYLYSQKGSSDTTRPWTYLMSPQIDITTSPINSLETRFQFLTSSSSSGIFVVGVVSDTANIKDSFYPIDTIRSSRTGTWEEFEVSLAGYPADSLNGRYIVYAAMHNYSSTSYEYNYYYIDDITIDYLPSCTRPDNLQYLSSTESSVTLYWNDLNADHTLWDVAYGPVGFNPATMDETMIGTIEQFTTDTATIEYLSMGIIYDFYVRANCGINDQSQWRGPISAGAGVYLIPASGVDTLVACRAILADHGGLVSDYNSYCSGSIVVFPNTEDSVAAVIGGTINTEYDYDWIKIYDGIGTVGTTLLYQISGNVAMDTIIKSSSGPLTIAFTSDGSGNYSGFQLLLGCAEAPTCAEVQNITVESVAGRSASLAWSYNENVINHPTSFVIELYDENGLVDSYTTTETYYLLSQLNPETEYGALIFSYCQDGSIGDADSVAFKTKCLNEVSISIGNGTTSTGYMPTYVYYNYSYTQQLFEPSELQGAASIQNVSFLQLSNYTTTRNLKIYLGNTTQASLSPSTAIPNSDMTLVYNGSYTFVPGQNLITFDTPFQYDGTSNLVLAVDDNTGGYSSTLNMSAHAATGKAIYCYSDYTNVDYNSGTLSNLSSRSDVKFGYCDSSTCVPPTVVVSSVQTNQVDIMWTEGNDETSWTAEYRILGDTAWTIADNNVTTTSYSFVNLNDGTEYEFAVSSNCGTRTSSRRIVTAITRCLPVTEYPFVENFDSWASGSSAVYGSTCWGRSTNYTTNYPYVNTSYASSGHNSMYFYGSSSYYSALILPKFSLPFDSLQMTFSMRVSDNTYQLQVGVVTDPENLSTFTLVKNIVPTATNRWQIHDVPFDSYTGDEGYIAILAPVGVNSYPYVDDIEVYRRPACGSRPGNLVVNDADVTPFTAIVSWTDTVNTSWIVEYGESGFEVGTGMRDYATSTSHNIQGLNPATNYDVYVYGICTSSDTGRVSMPTSFLTKCAPISNFPFTEDFESYSSGYSTVARYPMCWSAGSNANTSYTAYPYFSAIDGSISQYLYCAVTDTANSGLKYTYLTLPPIDSIQYQLNNMMISFRAKANYNSTLYDQRLYVGVSTNPNDINTFVVVDTIDLSTTTEWVSVDELDFSNYTGTGNYVTFVVRPIVPAGYSSAYSNIYIDDIELDLIPTCLRPADITLESYDGTSMTLSWTERNNATSWTIEYGVAGFTQGEGTVVTANSNPYTVTGLQTTTLYDFYVKSNCSATDESRYSRATRFITSQNLASVPYSYDFETENEWNNWDINCNRSDVNWYRGTATAAQGTASLYISADSGATVSTANTTVNAAAYRDFDFGANDTSYTLTFKAKAGGNPGSSTADGLAVFVVDPSVIVNSSSSYRTSPWGSVTYLDVLALVRMDSVFNEYSVQIDNLSGVKRLVFFYFNQSGTMVGGPAAIDDINIDYTTCMRPTNIAVSNITSSTATLSWDASASGYIVYYRAANDSIEYTQTSTSNTCTITGLTDSPREYYWSVKAICGNDTSVMSEIGAFTTACFDDAISTFPYTESFETTLDCWEQEYVRGSISWTKASSVKTSVNAYDGSSLALFKVANKDGNTTTLISPRLDLTAIDAPYIKFAHVQPVWSSDQDTLGVYYRTNPNADWVYLASYTSDIASWQVDSLPLPNASANYQIGFRATSLYGYGVGIDDIFINGEELACPAPSLTSVVANNTATISWTQAGDYELRYRKADEDNFGQEIVLSNVNNYTITGLDPLTEYVCQVRRNCGNDLGYSNWAETRFTTEELPCDVPTNIVVSNITYTSATVTWTDPNGTQTSWNVEYGYGENTQVITATTNSIELTDLYAGTVYSVRVQGNCSATVSSEWSEVYTFSTTTCESVSNLTADGITSSSATIAWTAPAGQTKWEITYGMQGVDEEHGTRVVVENDPTYTIEGLEEDMTYDVYVRAICQEGVYSAWSTKLQFTTRPVSINTAANDNVNVRIYPNPANTEATISVEGINGKVEFAVADMNGRMIVTETINCEGQLVKTIDVSNLAKGAYFVHIYNDNFNTTRKLIVK